MCAGEQVGSMWSGWRGPDLLCLTVLGSAESSLGGRAWAQGHREAHLLSQGQICPPGDCRDHG